MQQAGLIAAFINHLQTERRLSSHTVLNYGRDLQRLRRYLEKLDIDCWNTVNPALARGFVGESYRQGLSGRSISRMLSSVRTFYRYLIREKSSSEQPVRGSFRPQIREAASEDSNRRTSYSFD